MNFEDNTITDYEKYDSQNLFMCQLLNLRNSSFTSVSQDHLFSLVYIDVAFSRIKDANLNGLVNLLFAITDNLQHIQARDVVKVSTYYNTLEYLKQEKVSLGTAVKSTLGELSLSFAENIIPEYAQFGQYDLRFSKYLNLRSSLFEQFDAEHMTSLLFVDIAFSRIKDAYLDHYETLQKVAHDLLQIVLVRYTVEV